MGGTGAFAVAAALPERFSCAAPLSGSVRDSREMRAALADLPVWAIAAARDFLAALRAVNPDARYTEVEDAGHFDLPARAYLDGEVGLVRWLLSHER